MNLPKKKLELAFFLFDVTIWLSEQVLILLEYAQSAENTLQMPFLLYCI
jgi:hypothetical protein